MAEPTHAELREAIIRRVIPKLREELDALDLTAVATLHVKLDQIVNIEGWDAIIPIPLVNGFDPGVN